MPEPLTAETALGQRLLAAREAGAQAVFLDAGQPEHRQLAADAEALVLLLHTIRREAALAYPRHLSPVDLDRLILTALDS